MDSKIIDFECPACKTKSNVLIEVSEVPKTLRKIISVSTIPSIVNKKQLSFSFMDEENK